MRQEEEICLSQKVLITGAAGQLGNELIRTAPAHYDCLAATRDQLDVTDARQVSLFFEKQRPEIVINAAAYTAVDLAESEPGQASLINADAAGFLAAACAENNARLLHVSTDFVFDGTASSPYAPGANTSAIAGE